MADDAFALSPINARASLPTEADYDAICSAFMETARGRWFLGEYAKRNRNADTHLVLEAVGRMETALASQKHGERSLDDLLPGIVESIDDARQRILADLPKPDSRPVLEPLQRAATLLRDVAWALRESGAETRICDLLDIQAKAIADGCVRIQALTSSVDVPALVSDVLDDLTGRIAALFEADVPSQGPAAAPATPSRPEPAATAPVEPVAPLQARAPAAETSQPEPVSATATEMQAPQPEPAEAPAAVVHAPLRRPAADEARPARASEDQQFNLLIVRTKLSCFTY